MNEYAGAINDRRYAGTILVDGKDVAITRRCVHCGCHWVPIKGSGRKRSFCLRCDGHTCGPECPVARFGCVPFDVYLLALENKVDLNNIPVMGRVEGDVPKDSVTETIKT